MSILETLVVAWCLCVVCLDLYERRIPNTLVLTACTLAIVHVLVTGQTILGSSWQSMLMGVGIGLMLTLPSYALRLLGSGDVKLMFALSLMSSWYFTMLAFVIATMLAILFILIHLLLAQFRSVNRKPKRWIPYGAAFSAGLVCAMRIAA